MQDWILEPNATASWHRLVVEAETRTDSVLEEGCESYLVFLLMRYLRCRGVARRALALGFLEALEQAGGRRRESLRDVGDQCLIVAGLFPQLADRRRVTLSYFVDLGTSAYDEAATGMPGDSEALFRALARAFVPMTDVLRAIRDDPRTDPMEPLEAAERAFSLDSRHARRRLETYTEGTPVPGPRTRH